MANILNTEKQAAVIGALVEDMSIRGIERMTGIHRDTIMRLGVRVGESCTAMMDAAMQKLSCNDIQLDELWAFVGKKQRNIETHEDSFQGDQYTFVALDRDTKLVPCFRVGKRDKATAVDFLQDLHGRLANRVQLSSDAFKAYAEAVERGFGSEVDYGQIVKVFTATDLGQRRYSPPDIFSSSRHTIQGNPDRSRICTSHIEAQNLTIRMHCRRLTRLTNAFSKKLENFKAAVGLHFAYYNFVKVHGSIRCTPAMAAGVASSPWTVNDLVSLPEAA